ncbi:MAG TPA: lactonase family protein [Candidatus Methylomirabilis sp.]|nr:lactonase family protein [Candidatus Methylomirabilis sp.]
MKKPIRSIAFLSVFAVGFTLLPSARAQDKPAAKGQYIAYVGTYTTKTNSKGIYAYRFDAAKGQLTAIGVAAETTDPSFLAVHPDGKHLYAVNEIGNFNGGSEGAVSSFAIDAKAGTLKFLNQVSTRGPGPCYVSLDKTGAYVLVANYDGGSIASLPVQGDGTLGTASGFVQHSGSGPNKERQEGPHAHWIGTSPDNRFALAVDLGLDEVIIYNFDATKGTFTPMLTGFAKVKPGAGPRHLAFHPNGKFAYVLSEMESSVTAFSYQPKDGALKPLQTISALPQDYTGRKEAAEIAVHPSGKFLYTSNRGHDSIAIFGIDKKGMLKSLGYVLTGGKTPRHFAIDPAGNYLLAENQESNNIVVFHIDAATGSLTPTGQTVEVPSPVCVTFVAAK